MRILGCVVCLALLLCTPDLARAKTSFELPLHLGTDTGSSVKPALELSPSVFWNDLFGVSISYAPFRFIDQPVWDSNDTASSPHVVGELRTDLSVRYCPGSSWSTDLIAGIGAMSPNFVGSDGSGTLLEGTGGLRITKYFETMTLGGRLLVAHKKGTMSVEAQGTSWDTDIAETTVLVTVSVGIRI